MTRFFVAGFQHETNTFSPDVTSWSAFEAGDFFPPCSRGVEMLEMHEHGAMPMAGFIASARSAGAECIGSIWAGASPGGRVTEDAFDRITQTILNDIEDAVRSAPLTGVYLDLHGAAVGTHHDSLEEALLVKVRQAVGVDVPIVVSLDLHANVPSTVHRLADALVAYRTYPHVDMVETGQRAFELLMRRLKHRRREPRFFLRMPFLIPVVSQSTLQAPAEDVYRLLGDLEAEHAVSLSLALGFPAANVEYCGPSVWGYGADAEQCVRRLYDHIVATRSDWRVEAAPEGEAVRQALRVADEVDGLVIIADAQDNPGAGADSSTTGLLRELLDSRAGSAWPARVAIGLIHDAHAAEAAARAGIGAKLSLSIGRSSVCFDGALSPEPVTAECTVVALSNGKATLNGPMMRGAIVQAGLSACLLINGIYVLVSSAKTQMIDRSLYLMLGVEAERMKLLVNKSAVHFRADFQPIAAAILVGKSPGIMAIDPSELPWTKLSDQVEPFV